METGGFSQPLPRSTLPIAGDSPSEMTVPTPGGVYCSASLTLDYSRFSVAPPLEHFFSLARRRRGAQPPLPLPLGPGLDGVVFA